MAPLWQLGAKALADGFRTGAFTPTEALEDVLARSEVAQSCVNAFVHLDVRGAREAAQASTQRWSRGEPLSALDGVPLSLKDNLHAKGMPTSWGSALVRGYMPPDDELPVARLRAAGAVIFGKTNLPEYALQGITDNLVFGATRNPWNPDLTPGGSSGGGAAAVASGCGPLALVTDGGGSTRRPASHTGLVGFKPSSGLIARGGGVPEIFLEFEVPGVLARDVADATLMAQVLAQQPFMVPSAAPARILYLPRFAGHPVDAGIARVVDEAARRMESLGHEVTLAPNANWAEEINAVWPLISAAGLAWMLVSPSRFAEFRLAPGAACDLSRCTDATRANVEAGSGASSSAVFAAFAAVHALRQRMDELFASFDFLLTPATAALPWPARESHPARIDGLEVGPRGHAIFTAFANAAGLPAIAMPGGFVDGLPTGFQLVARAGADAQLLALALQYETALPSSANPQARRWPALTSTILSTIPATIPAT